MISTRLHPSTVDLAADAPPDTKEPQMKNLNSIPDQTASGTTDGETWSIARYGTTVVINIDGETDDTEYATRDAAAYEYLTSLRVLMNGTDASPAMNALTSGYVDCSCRDCFDIAITNDVRRAVMCLLCTEAGCSPNNGTCERTPDDREDI